MHPDLIRFNGFAIHTYGVLVAAGFLAGVAFSIREGRLAGIPKQQILDLCFYLLLAAIIGSRLLYVILYLDEYLESPLAIFAIWKGGLVFSGGLIAALVTGLVLAGRWKMGMWRTADVMAPGIALGQAIGRIGCFFAGCCYGDPTDAFCAVTFTDPDSLAPLFTPLHPTQLYSSGALLLIFLILWAFRNHTKWQGQVFCLYVFLHSSARLIIEEFRGDARGEVFGGAITVTQLVAMILLAASIIAWIVLKRKHSTQ